MGGTGGGASSLAWGWPCVMGTSWATIVPSSVGGESTFFVAVKWKKYQSQESRALYVVPRGEMPVIQYWNKRWELFINVESLNICLLGSNS